MMDVYTLRRYFRNGSAGGCLSRERLLLGLRNVVWRMSLQVPPEALRGWLWAFGEEFDLAEEEVRFLQPPNMPPPDGTRRRMSSFSRRPSPFQE